MPGVSKAVGRYFGLLTILPEVLWFDIGFGRYAAFPRAWG